MSIESEAIELIRMVRQLLKEEGPIFASPADCAYFRQFFRAPSLTPKIANSEENKSITQVATQQTLSPFPPPPKEVPPLEKKTTSSLPQILSPEIAPPKKGFASQPKSDRFEEVRSILAKIAPQWPILDEIPNDQEAKLLAERWKTNDQLAPLMIFYLNETPLEVQFLKNFTKALPNAHLAAAQQFEQTLQWPSLLASQELKLVLISASTLKTLPNLLKCYRKTSAGEFLLKVPLLLLPEVSSYLENPLSKRTLWEVMKKMYLHK